MQTILVPIDFSPASRAASLYAASLAKATGARILLFHAYMLPTPATEVPYVMISVDELQTDNEKLARTEAETLHKNFGVEVQSLVRIGMPADEIAATAEENGHSLIVIGMRGAGTLDKIIGSTTASVVRKSKTPVLVVPHDSVFTPVKQVVYASDLSYNTTPGLFQPMLGIVQTYNAEVHVIHVTKTGKATGTEQEAAAKEAISANFGTVNHDFTIIHDESIRHGIKQYVDEHGAQLLVMVAHKHSFFDRLFSRIHTTDMAYETRVPLMVLHDA